MQCALIKARQSHCKVAFIVSLSLPPCYTEKGKGNGGRGLSPACFNHRLAKERSAGVTQCLSLGHGLWIVGGGCYMALRGRQSTKIDCLLIAERRRATHSHSLINAKKFDD